MISFNKSYLFAVAAGAALLSSCSKEMDFSDPNANVKAYEKNWGDKFGAIDPNQNWNMAARATANINLESISTAECYVKIYSDNPVDGGKLIASTSVRGSKVLDFDITKGNLMVYVKVVNDYGELISGYYPINDNVLNIGKPQTRSAVGECNTTVGEEYVLELPGDETTGYQNRKTSFYQLNNVTTSIGESWKVKDFRGILDVEDGKDGVFKEGNNNVEKWKDVLDDDVVYVMANDGGITLDLNYRNTTGNNKFGYFYYTGENVDINAVKKYILIDKPCDRNNSYVQYSQYTIKEKWDNVYDANGNYVGWQLVGTEEAYADWTNFNGNDVNVFGMSDNTLVRGTKFELVYFGTDGNDKGSYTFPKGTKIGFFVIQDNYGPYNNKLYYSLSDLNEANGVFASTYNYGGTTFLGFEDYTDKDLNDILFFATGDFEKPVEINPTPEPEAQSWVIACEDLGDTDDFDFNDVVFSVSHVSGTNTATVTPLAAGGNLASTVKYNGQPIADNAEIHHLLQSNVSVGDNGTYPLLTDVPAGDPLTIVVDENFSMTNHKFSITVEGNGDSRSITMGNETGKAPMMLCLPGAWAWPKERVQIYEAYPMFRNWVQNSNENEWYKSFVEGSVVR